jgi:hypothetical protein
MRAHRQRAPYIDDPCLSAVHPMRVFYRVAGVHGGGGDTTTNAIFYIAGKDRRRSAAATPAAGICAYDEGSGLSRGTTNPDTR